MKVLFSIGLVLVLLGLISLVVPIPHNERQGVSAGGLSVDIQTRHSEKVSPIISAVMILGGAGMMVVGGLRRT